MGLAVGGDCRGNWVRSEATTSPKCEYLARCLDVFRPDAFDIRQLKTSYGGGVFVAYVCPGVPLLVEKTVRFLSDLRIIDGRLVASKQGVRGGAAIGSWRRPTRKSLAVAGLKTPDVLPSPRRFIGRSSYGLGSKNNFKTELSSPGCSLKTHE